jgi:putative flippase GtrA
MTRSADAAPAAEGRARYRGLMGQFASFCAVGAGGFFVDAGTLYLVLHASSLNAYSGRLVSYLTAATFTWALNRRFTFQGARTGGVLGEWARYVATGAVGGLANLAAYSVVVACSQRLHDPGHLVLALTPYAGVAVGSAIGLLINYGLARKVVFRSSAG